MKTIEKFPVVSPQGNEYLVRFLDEDVGFGIYRNSCELIVEQTRIFSFLPKKKIVLYRVTLTKDFDCNYRETAESIVRDYEDWLESERQKEAREAHYLSEFKAWDGIIR